VVGIEARGFIIAAPVAHRLGAGFVPVRKVGKLPWEVEAEAYELEVIDTDAARVRVVIRGDAPAATPKALERFDLEGYGFDASVSTAERLVFRRKV